MISLHAAEFVPLAVCTDFPPSAGIQYPALYHSGKCSVGKYVSFLEITERKHCPVIPLYFLPGTAHAVLIIGTGAADRILTTGETYIGVCCFEFVQNLCKIICKFTGVAFSFKEGKA